MTLALPGPEYNNIVMNFFACECLCFAVRSMAFSAVICGCAVMTLWFNCSPARLLLLLPLSTETNPALPSARRSRIFSQEVGTCLSFLTDCFQDRGPPWFWHFLRWGNVSLHYGRRIAPLVHCAACENSLWIQEQWWGKVEGGNGGDSGEFQWHSYQIAFPALFLSSLGKISAAPWCRGHVRSPVSDMLY